MTARFSSPFAVLVMTCKSWKKPPTGATIFPPTLSWSSSGLGMRGGATPRRMASNGARSGHPW
jgi:hypothetical protein